MGRKGFISGFLDPLRGKPKSKYNCVYDIETTTDLTRVYLVGFYDGSHYRYFESKPMVPEETGSSVDQFMTWLVNSREHRNAWLWAHNGGNFDTSYILPWLKKHHKNVKAIPIQSSILCITVPSNTNRGKIQFLDSLKLLNLGLEKLAKSYGLPGKVKDIDYNTLHTDPRRYAYLEQDCRLLYECLTRFIAFMGQNGSDIGMTAPATAMKAFRRVHLQKMVPRHIHFASCKDELCDRCLHKFVRQAYYGGRVEVFKERFEGPGNLYVADFNSMYPAAMLEPMPVKLAMESLTPGKQIRFDYLVKNWLGFVECEIEIPEDTYIPPLPHRWGGKLIFPVGTLRGVWSSVEIHNAIQMGCEVTWWGKSAWFRGAPIFKDYVEHWYKYRDKSSPDWNSSYDSIAKLMMNSLYGKTGMKEERESLHINPDAEFMAEHSLTPMKDFEDGLFLEQTFTSPSYVIPNLAAWVTALARVRLLQELTTRDVWYCDTDSIFTNQEFVSDTKLGGLKLESTANEGTFVAPKMYMMRMADGTDKVKMKGFSGGFGAPPPDREKFKAIINGGQMTINRATKFREAMRDGTGPMMKKVTKSMKSKDTKRVHLPNGDTRPWKVVRNSAGKERLA